VRRVRLGAPHTLRVEVEVQTLAELEEAIAARADAVLLDNMDDEQIGLAVKQAAGRVLLEVSGGVSLERVPALSRLGVDVISVGRLTHSAGPSTSASRPSGWGSSVATRDAALLQALEGGAWVSGADLARAQGVSRAAVGKQVGVLRRHGFRIEAAPRRGYRLVAAPDLLLPALVRRCCARAASGGSSGTTSASARPTTRPRPGRAPAHPRGRGARRGAGARPRPHRAPLALAARENLYLSLVLRPPRPPHLVPPLTLAAGLAVFDVCAARGLRPELKWPNDVLLDGRRWPAS